MRAQWVMGRLTILMGVIAAGVGIAVANRALRSARRVHRRTASRSAAALESWHAWCLGGFSGVTMGLRWLSAVAAMGVCALAGIVLIGLGIRLFIGDVSIFSS